MARSKSARRSDALEAIDCVSRLADVFQRRRAQLAEQVGLTDKQWEVLEEISSEHFMPTMFARERDSSPAAVSKTIRQLVDKKLVTVAVSRGDARQREYELTRAGRTVMDRLRAAREDAIGHVWLNLGGERLREFTRFGRELVARLEEYARVAARKETNDG